MPEANRGQHAERNEMYKTLDLMYELANYLNSWYQTNKTYPSSSEWARLAFDEINGVKLSQDGMSILDGFGSPIVYIRRSQEQVEFYSPNLFDGDEEGDQKAQIFLLKSGIRQYNNKRKSM